MQRAGLPAQSRVSSRDKSGHTLGMTNAAHTIGQVLAHITATRPQALDRLRHFLAIPSVSAQPAHAEDCRQAGEWARSALEDTGFEARLVETAGHPVILAQHPGPGGDAPHLLYYGHYDVQPAEPIDLWESPAFEPTIVDGANGPRIVARGAVDDKGQVSMWMEAFRAWHEVTGGLPVRVTVILEGEEEVSSPNLEPFLQAHNSVLRADVAVVSDTNMWNIETPAITTRLRGIVYAELRVRAPSRDLHSGLYGGSALNPLNALTKLLGGLHDDTGRVQLPGFYEGVADISAEQAAEWRDLSFDETSFLRGIGLSAPAGEAGRDGLDRLWARPTADINGIWGGYQGDGAKTVIASEAGAKVSFRLVAGQDPARIADLFRAWVAANTPRDLHSNIAFFGQAPGFEVAPDNPYIGVARKVLADEYGRPAVLIGSGGSIPVVESLRRILGLDTLLMGFGLDDDQVHSPNEKFDLRCLDHGTNAHARLLGAVAAG
jgi:acetylornithine deacetylase/succinyl-diaminopimelate desuccinylase-like protein